MCGLEARLCRREAELELCLRDGVGTKFGGGVGTNLRDGAGATLRDGVDTLLRKRVPTPQPTHNQSQAPLQMTDDEAIRMLELTATRNRALEVEVRDLFRRVSRTFESYTVFLFAFLAFELCLFVLTVLCAMLFLVLWSFLFPVLYDGSFDCPVTSSFCPS